MIAESVCVVSQHDAAEMLGDTINACLITPWAAKHPNCREPSGAAAKHILKLWIRI